MKRKRQQRRQARKGCKKSNSKGATNSTRSKITHTGTIPVPGHKQGISSPCDQDRDQKSNKWEGPTKKHTSQTKEKKGEKRKHGNSQREAKKDNAPPSPEGK